MESDRLAKILVPTLAILVLLTSLGQISAVTLLAIMVVVLAGAYWALPHERRIEESARDESVDTAVAAAILDALPDPVVLLDRNRKVIAANDSATKTLGERLRDRDLSQSLRHPEALDAVGEVLAGADYRSISITLPAPVPKSYELHIVGLDLKSKNSPRAILVLHDVTATRAAEQMRADFVANVSHELRSPLSSLLGFIETLKGAAKDDQRARERFLDIMEDEAGRMSRLIRDLLSLSRVESEEHVLPAGRVDVSQMLRQVNDALSIRAKGRNVNILLDISEGLPPVPGDADELQEVFHNLVDNAIKYGRADGVVRISVDEIDRIPDLGGAGIRINISDEGDGIEPEHLPRLTERFYRIDKGRSREMGGTGLGLAIVKHIISRHRGRLMIDSAIGVGTTFSIFLPRVNTD
jgi:two-component system, OmpR family, phosphate regulon sensor histidine kinase PhoR